MLNINDIKLACTADTTVFTNHARERMRERNIRYVDIASSIADGVIIEQYEDDKPYPSCLILGYSEKKPLHVVLSLDRGILWVITTYTPTLAKWEEGYKIRKVVS